MQNILNSEAVSNKSINVACLNMFEQAYEKHFLFWLSLF